MAGPLGDEGWGWAARARRGVAVIVVYFIVDAPNVDKLRHLLHTTSHEVSNNQPRLASSSRRS